MALFTLNIGNSSQFRYLAVKTSRTGPLAKLVIGDNGRIGTVLSVRFCPLGSKLSIVDAAAIDGSLAYVVVAIVEPRVVGAQRVDVSNVKPSRLPEIHVPGGHAPLVNIPISAPATGGSSLDRDISRR